MPQAIRKLDDFAINLRFHSNACLEVLKEVLGHMTNYEARRSQDDNNGDDEQTKYAKLFMVYGGVEVCSL